MSILNVQNVGKAYRTYSSEWKRFASWFGIAVTPSKEHWVLRNINFDIQHGEAIGIIGHNGAGKSTLLKMITGTLQPTEGQVQVSGHIAAILELGMGFNQELTGRQNVLHTAGLMGYSVEQIQNAMPDIEAFAEIGEYFDEPVRTYSSGMQMRVAFSVATAYRPDILIIDEALSVGDAYFQHKSFNRIRDFRDQGTSLLFVSHDKGAILELCDKAIYINSGTIEAQGTPNYIMDYYNAQVIKKDDTNITLPGTDEPQKIVSGNNKATVENVRIYNENDHEIEIIDVGENIKCNIRVIIRKDIERLTLGYQIKDRLGREVFGTNTKYTDQVLFNCKAGESYDFCIHFKATMGPDTYSIATALVDTDGVALLDNYEWNELATVFKVINSSQLHFIGCAWIPPNIKINKL